MPAYIFSCRRLEWTETVHRECQGAEQAVAYGRRYLEQVLQEQPPTAEPTSVTVAQDNPGEGLLWLGGWDWTLDGGCVWSPLD